jgi:uncharacterized protein (DUF2344 family)
MFLTFLKTIGLKNIAIILFTLAVVGFYAVQQRAINSLESDLKDSKKTIKEAKEEALKAESNFNQTVEAYEYSLKVQNELAVQKQVTAVEKEKVVAKHQTLIKEVEKRGEIKQDEKSDFVIVTF